MTNILLFGGRGGAQVLATLAKAGHHVGWVIDTDPSHEGQASLARVAENQGRSVLSAASLKDVSLTRALGDAGIDIILCVRCRLVLPPEVVGAARLGSYNLHLGPLPAYAGRNVVSWAIYNAEEEHGVTLHRMTPEVDRGGIVSASQFPITETDTALSVTKRAMKEGISLIVKMLDGIAKTGRTPAVFEQPATRRHYYLAKDRPDMKIDWRRPSAEILRLARACDFHPFPSPWGLPQVKYDNRTLEVLRLEAAAPKLNPSAEPGSILRFEDGAAIVATGDEAVRLESFLADGVILEAAEILEPHARLETPTGRPIR